MNRLSIALVAIMLAAPAIAGEHASGDAAAGEIVFKKCQTCHVVRDPDGNVLAGRSSKTGPNLYGLPGRAVASVEDYRYGKSIAALGETGVAWDEESFVEYVQDPKAYLARVLDDKKARTKMSFKLGDADDAANVWAFIASLSPEPES